MEKKGAANGVVKRVVYILIQCTWGIIQSFVGLIVFLLLVNKPHRFYRCAILTEYDINSTPFKFIGSVSLGMFIFSKSDPGTITVPHEYGHTFQSLIFGPLYLFLVGIPSLSWCLYYGKHREELESKGISYYSRYPENWATDWGLKISEKPW